MHFDDITWLDFVRGLLTSDQAWLMQQHLTVGCEECKKAHAFWLKMQDFATRDASYEPSRADVLIASEADLTERAEPTLPCDLTAAMVTFDSFRSAMAAGFRSGLTQARYVIYEAEPWTISLRIKSELGNQMFLTGQITKAGMTPDQTPGMPLMLQGADSLLRSTFTSGSGEFHLQYRSASNIRLLVKISPEQTLEIRLPDPETIREGPGSEE